MAPFDHTGTLIVMANPDSHELVCASSTAASHRCGAISGSRFCTVNSTVHSSGGPQTFSSVGEPGHSRDGHTDLSASNLRGPVRRRFRQKVKVTSRGQEVEEAENEKPQSWGNGDKGVPTQHTYHIRVNSWCVNYNINNYRGLVCGDRCAVLLSGSFRAKIACRCHAVRAQVQVSTALSKCASPTQVQPRSVTVSLRL